MIFRGGDIKSDKLMATIKATSQKRANKALDGQEAQPLDEPVSGNIHHRHSVQVSTSKSIVKPLKKSQQELSIVMPIPSWSLN